MSKFTFDPDDRKLMTSTQAPTRSGCTPDPRETVKYEGIVVTKDKSPINHFPKTILRNSYLFVIICASYVRSIEKRSTKTDVWIVQRLDDCGSMLKRLMKFKKGETRFNESYRNNKR